MIKLLNGSLNLHVAKCAVNLLKVSSLMPFRSNHLHSTTDSCREWVYKISLEGWRDQLDGVGEPDFDKELKPGKMSKAVNVGLIEFNCHNHLLQNPWSWSFIWFRMTMTMTMMMWVVRKGAAWGGQGKWGWGWGTRWGLRFPLPENDNKIFKKNTNFCDIFLTMKWLMKFMIFFSKNWQCG
jgi:hypothetical protein